MLQTQCSLLLETTDGATIPCSPAMDSNHYCWWCCMMMRRRTTMTTRRMYAKPNCAHCLHPGITSPHTSFSSSSSHFPIDRTGSLLTSFGPNTHTQIYIHIEMKQSHFTRDDQWKNCWIGWKFGAYTPARAPISIMEEIVEWMLLMHLGFTPEMWWRRANYTFMNFAVYLWVCVVGAAVSRTTHTIDLSLVSVYF